MQIWLNWLGQGAALTLLIALVTGGRRSINAATRERIWFMTLVVISGMPLLSILMPVLADTTVGAVAALPAPMPHTVVEMTPVADIVLASLWVAWFAIATTRLAAALLQLRRAKARVSPFPSAREARLRHWTALRHQGRITRLVISPDVHRAAVLGMGEPLIAIAPEMLVRLSDDELDQVIVHEYAHVQRRDDFGIVVQRIMTAVGGLHPAVWWINRVVAIEREVACDDWVVARSRAVRGYAACLVQLAASREPGVWNLSPGAVRSLPQISTRVKRLLERGRNANIAPSRRVLGLAQPAILAVACVAASVPVIEVIAERPTIVTPHVRAAVAAIWTLPARPEASRATDTATLVRVAVPPEPAAAGVASSAEPRPLRAIAQSETVRLSPTWTTFPRVEIQDGGQRADQPASVHQQDPHAAVIPATDAAAQPTSPPVATLVHPPAPPPIWQQAADAGVAVGKGSREAAVRTGAFFSRFGKSVARSF